MSRYVTDSGDKALVRAETVVTPHDTGEEGYEGIFAEFFPGAFFDDSWVD